MNTKSEKAIKSIGRSISNINKQIKIIREEYPEAGIYVENGDSFNIMKGATHTRDNANSPLHNNVIVCYNLIHSECGAW